MKGYNLQQNPKSQGEIPIEFGPSNPERIRTVDHSSVRIGVRDFEMSKSLVNENLEIAKHDIAIQSQPLIQAEIKASSAYRTSGNRSS
jgi:hypothetical protein